MKPTIAYFSAEFSVADSLPIFAGGLGILAGDVVQEAGEEGRDFHAFGLVYHEAFARGDQDKRQISERLKSEGFSLILDSQNDPLITWVKFGGRSVGVHAWQRKYGTANLILLDSKILQNNAKDQAITNRLYDSAPGVMLNQQILLGFASIQLLKYLEITPDFYHLNEGHMSFAGLAAAIQYQKQNPKINLKQALEQIQPKLVATKHTILAGAGLVLSRDDLTSVLLDQLVNAHGNIDLLFSLGGRSDGYFSTTKFLVNICKNQSGVSEIHVRSEHEFHPTSRLIATTNGVYEPRWRAENLKINLNDISDDQLQQLRRTNKINLLNYIKEQTNKEFSPDVLTVVWARRMTAYKRPELLVSDLERLAEIANHSSRPIQFIVGGTANPSDEVGMDLVSRIVSASQKTSLNNRIAYVPNYNPATAKILAQGADVWLNTPIRGKEACGTSGMKASLNGALQFSTSDGWVDEIDIKPIGWELPENADAKDLYDILEQQIAPLFYENYDAWMLKIKANIDLIEQQFTAKQMIYKYYQKLYK